MIYKDVYKNATKTELIKALEDAIKITAFPNSTETALKDVLILNRLERLAKNKTKRAEFKRLYKQAVEAGIINE